MATFGRRTTGIARTADRSQHPRLPGREPGAGEEHRLAESHVGAGEGDRGAGHAGAAHHDGPAVIFEVGVLDRNHRIGTAGKHAARRDRAGGSGLHLLLRRHAGGNRLRVAAQANRLLLRGTEGVLRADGEPVHVRTVEAGNVDFGADVGGQQPAQCLLQGDVLAAQGLLPRSPRANGARPRPDP